jgi:hypothetical protein
MSVIPAFCPSISLLIPYFTALFELTNPYSISRPSRPGFDRLRLIPGIKSSQTVNLIGLWFWLLDWKIDSDNAIAIISNSVITRPQPGKRPQK